MFYDVRRLIRKYPNGAVFALGLCMAVIPEVQSQAIFRSYYAIHYGGLAVPPFAAGIIDFWWVAEHKTAFMFAAIGTTVIGAILMLIVGVRWMRQGIAWTRGPARRSAPLRL